MTRSTAPRRARTTVPGILLTLVGSAALALATPLGASAHVTIDGDHAAAGSYALITFKVPTESDTATTNSVTLTLPADTPFVSVRYVPVPGWTTRLVRTTLPAPVMVGDGEITEAVTQVIWTAQPGAEIPAGALQLFPLSLGPVPDVASLALPVDQGYSDGSVVSWSESGDGAEHPAPVLFVSDDTTTQTESPAGTASPDVLARVLGIGGLALGAAGIAFGLVRRPKAGA